MVDGDHQLHPLAFPVGILRDVEEIGRLARPVEEDEAAVLVAVGQKGSHGGPQRGQAKPAGHQQDVAAARLLDRPAAAVGPAQAHDRARPSLPITSRDPADEADRVADPRPFLGRPLETEIGTSPTPGT